MHVLLLGYSDIARRRVIPALLANGVRQLDIASRHSMGAIARPAHMSGQDYGDYEQALRESAAAFVWISTVNANHVELAAKALAGGRHVMIDKPAVSTLAQAEHLAELAQRQQCVLAEAAVYPFHPQMAAARQFFSEAGSAPTQAVAAFSFPPFPSGNFRNDPALGGGMRMDLGSYAVSIGRVLFAAPPLEIVCRSLQGDTGFSVLMTYPGGRSVVGHFGATTGYVNRLILLGASAVLTLERAFTTPPDMVCRLEGSVRNAPTTREVAPADSFALFVEAVFKAVRNANSNEFRDALLTDAKAVERLRQVSLEF